MSNIDWLVERPIAHRGFHDMNKAVFENTQSAFQRAVAAGFAIECDLQFAADGVPVVFHDDTLERLCGLRGDVREKLSGELQQLTVGGTRDRIPTFADMLRQVKGAVPLVVELKGRAGDDEGFAGAVLEALEGYRGPVALMSFDHWLLRELKELGVSLPIGLTAEGARPETYFEHDDAMALGLDFISYNIHHLPNDFIGGMRARGMPVISWTVRDADQRRKSDEFADQITFEGFDPRDR
jgi:glycerophosphoryl diester phosphodiesterase